MAAALMSDTRSLTTGSPVAVDVAAIEQELTSFWKSASENGTGGAAIRACSCNFIAVARDKQEAERLPETLAKVSEWHPCRSLIAYRDDSVLSSAMGSPSKGADGPRIQAWITAQCRIPYAGGPQICCESITLAAAAPATEALPNTLVSLLVPDLPVFLYWRSLTGRDRNLVERIAQFADLLIVDSHSSKADPDNREQLLELLMDPPRGIPVRDLNWCRLTPWRDLVAQFFDAPSARQFAWDISEVDVMRAVAAPGNLPTRTLLLAGWLAARLKWKRKSTWRHGDDWISTWTGKNGEVRLHFKGNPPSKGHLPGINSITLRTHEGSTFSVVREQGSLCLTARAETHGSVLLHSVPIELMDEASLLVRELSLSGEDSGFQSALAAAMQLERSFRVGSTG